MLNVWESQNYCPTVENWARGKIMRKRCTNTGNEPATASFSLRINNQFNGLWKKRHQSGGLSDKPRWSARSHLCTEFPQGMHDAFEARQDLWKTDRPTDQRDPLRKLQLLVVWYQDLCIFGLGPNLKSEQCDDEKMTWNISRMVVHMYYRVVQGERDGRGRCNMYIFPILSEFQHPVRTVCTSWKRGGGKRQRNDEWNSDGMGEIWPLQQSLES